MLHYSWSGLITDRAVYAVECLTDSDYRLHISDSSAQSINDLNAATAYSVFFANVLVARFLFGTNKYSVE